MVYNKQMKKYIFALALFLTWSTNVAFAELNIRPLDLWTAITAPYPAITPRASGSNLYMPLSSATTSKMYSSTYCINNTTPDCITSWPTSLPSAPGAGYWLTSTSTGAWIASSTDPMIIGSLIATTTSPSSIMGYVGIGTASPAHRLDVVGNINVSAGSAYKYNGANVITASTTLNNYFFGGAGNLTMTGAYNTASGVSALAFNTTGNYNTANGSLALYANTTGSDNSSFGVQSLFVNTSGSYNTSVGTLSLPSNTTGSNNTASGMGSLYSNTTGNNNASLGNNSLWGITTGNGNTAIGSYAGYGDGTANMQSTVDNYATFLGYQASRDASVASTTPLTNITAIGKNAKVGASNTIVLGGTGADAVNVGIGTVAPAYKLEVVGNLKTSTTIGTGGYTVATLPTGQATGTRAYVTDALAPTFLGTLTGGGAVVSPAFFNGSAWVAN